MYPLLKTETTRKVVTEETDNFHVSKDSIPVLYRQVKECECGFEYGFEYVCLNSLVRLYVLSGIRKKGKSKGQGIHAMRARGPRPGKNATRLGR